MLFLNHLTARCYSIHNCFSEAFTVRYFQVRLGELMSQTELKSFMGRHSDYLGKYQLDPDSLQELQKVELTRKIGLPRNANFFFFFQYLKMEQEGISHLIDVATADADHVRFMQQDMLQVRQSVINSSNTALLNRQAQFASSCLQNK